MITPVIFKVIAQMCRIPVTAQLPVKVETEQPAVGTLVLHKGTSHGLAGSLYSQISPPNAGF